MKRVELLASHVFNPKKIMMAKANKKWRELGICCSVVHYENYKDEYFKGGRNQQYVIANFVPWGRAQMTDTVLVTVEYSVKTENHKEIEIVKVTREVDIDGLNFEVSLIIALHSSPLMWICIFNRKNGVNVCSTFDFGEGQGSLEEIHLAFPDLDSYLPQTGEIDPVASISAMSNLNNRNPLPLVLLD